ncbi:hypothetical protein H0H92_005048 [Tricholoma furcatifolium]|nr:hypothetical protein H0H92_005048 [Tricholoma furcatifolium]
MFNLLRPLARAARTHSAPRRALCTAPQISTRNRLIWGSTAVVISTAASLAFGKTILLDSVVADVAHDTVVDPATGIEFPTSIRVPSKIKIPTMTLVGLGVRTVSFLGIKVYSVGFYADLENPNLKITQDMTTDEKIEHIVRNSACVVRIVPVRTTSYTHLRDAFMRALHARMALAKTNGTISEDEAFAAGSPMRKLKSLFPNSPLEKHAPLDIYLSAPSHERPRALVFRDLGAIESDWVATEFVLHYFEGAGPSPPLKKSVVSRLETFET